MSEFDARAAGWDADPAKVERARRVAEAIAGAVPALGEREVLEYGAGTGLLGLALRPLVAHVTLADSSPGMLSVANAKIAAEGLRNATTRLLDLTAQPLPEERYGLVCTLLTLHHVEDVDGLLRKFHALLAPGGWLCVSDLDAEDGSFHGPGFTGHRGFDRATLAAQLAQAGFEDVRLTTACEIAKGARGEERRYPVFLAVARRR